MYTLPGVMHYLQTEFTKNERDRIAWELERCEMKSRIALLEGENRTLRYELSTLKMKHPTELNNLDTSIQEPLLLKSKLAVQENVKEIVYLLKSPNVTDQLNTLTDKTDEMHMLESLNLGRGVNSGSGAIQTSNREGGVNYLDQSFNGADTLAESTERPPEQSHNNPRDRTNVEDSDTDTIIPEEMPHNRSKSEGRPRASSLFASKNGDAPPKLFLRCKRLRYHLASVDKLVVSNFNMLTYGRDGLMKHWMIEPNLNCNDKLTKSFHGCAPELLGLYWLDSQKFLTVDNYGLKVWSINENDPLLKLDVFQASTELKFDDILNIDFKNKWLVLTKIDKVHIWEVLRTKNNLKIGSKYTVQATSKIADSILGMTEKSLIVFYEDFCELVIYNFQGEVLQKVSLKDTIEKGRKAQTFNDVHVGKLYLNKQSSKLLIQLDNLISIYSFDRKKIILAEALHNVPTSVVFRSPRDYVVFAYDDGLVEVRKIEIFHKILKKYNHYDEEDEYETEDSLKHLQPLDDSEEDIIDDLRQNSHKGVIIDVTEIDSAPVIVSGGEDGIIRLERVVEVDK